MHKRFARLYRDVTGRRLRLLYSNIAEDLAAAVEAAPGARTPVIADVGCGPGNLLFQLAERLPAARLLGIDPSTSLLRAAGTASWSRVGGVAEALPLRDGSLDLVVTTGSIHHWSAPLQGARELLRVLRPEGQLLLYDQLRTLRPSMMMTALRQGFVGLGLSALPTHRIVEALEAAGFRDLDVREVGALLAIRARRPAGRLRGSTSP